MKAYNISITSPSPELWIRESSVGDWVQAPEAFFYKNRYEELSRKTGSLIEILQEYRRVCYRMGSDHEESKRLFGEIIKRERAVVGTGMLN